MFGFGFKFGYSPLSSNFRIVSNSIRQDLALLEFVWIFLKCQTWALQAGRLLPGRDQAGRRGHRHLPGRDQDGGQEAREGAGEMIERAEIPAMFYYRRLVPLL